MACVRVSRQFGRWKLASILALLALGLSGAAWADPGRSVLVLPVEAHWVLEPVRAAVAAALPETLKQAGYEAVFIQPTSPLVQMAVNDGWISLSPPNGEAVTQLKADCYLLARYAKTDAVLLLQLSSSGSEMALEGAISGAITQQPVTVRVTTASGEDTKAVGGTLAQQLAATLTPEVWASLGTDSEGRVKGAAVRFAAGQTAQQSGKWLAAAREYEVACAGDPEQAEYLAAAARALMACEQYDLALVRIKRAALLDPENREFTRQLGEISLEAKHFEQAQTAFNELLKAAPDDLAAWEGLARAQRGVGNIEGSRVSYLRLIGNFPELQEEPNFLATILSHLKDDDLWLSEIPPEAFNLALAHLYFDAGETTHGVRVLFAYHEGPEKPAYIDEEYLALAKGMDAEATRIMLAVEETLSQPRRSREEIDAVAQMLEALHTRSNLLADVGECVHVSPRLEAAHRYRVLAYNALNEANFEAQQYVQSNDGSHRRRAALLREMSRTSLKDAAARATTPAPVSLAPLPE